jgi:hypothetical protein
VRLWTRNFGTFSNGFPMDFPIGFRSELFRVRLGTFSFTLTYRHLMTKAWNWASQLFLTDDNGKCFHQIRVLMVLKFQIWWNFIEKFLWPNRDLSPGTLKWKSSTSPSKPFFSRIRTQVRPNFLIIKTFQNFLFCRTSSQN